MQTVIEWRADRESCNFVSNPSRKVLGDDRSMATVLLQPPMCNVEFDRCSVVSKHTNLVPFFHAAEPSKTSKVVPSAMANRFVAKRKLFINYERRKTYALEGRNNDENIVTR